MLLGLPCTFYVAELSDRGIGDHSFDDLGFGMATFRLDQHDPKFSADCLRIGSDALGRTATGSDVNFGRKHCPRVGGGRYDSFLSQLSALFEKKLVIRKKRFVVRSILLVGHFSSLA